MKLALQSLDTKPKVRIKKTDFNSFYLLLVYYHHHHHPVNKRKEILHTSCNALCHYKTLIYFYVLSIPIAIAML